MAVSVEKNFYIIVGLLNEHVFSFASAILIEKNVISYLVFFNLRTRKSGYKRRGCHRSQKKMQYVFARCLIFFACSFYVLVPLPAGRAAVPSLRRAVLQYLMSCLDGISCLCLLPCHGLYKAYSCVWMASSYIYISMALNVLRTNRFSSRCRGRLLVLGTLLLQGKDHYLCDRRSSCVLNM